MKEHTIQFSGLKDGRHPLSYELEQGFFAELADDDLPNGRLQANVQLDKTASMLVVDMHLEGRLNLLCDRCNTHMNYPVDGRLRQIFRIGGREQFEQDEITGLDPNAHEINLTQYLYECLRLALPLRRVHAHGDCDPTVLAQLEGISVSEEEGDPRWADLRRLNDEPA